MPADSLRVGIVGCGFVAREHYKAYSKIKGVSVISCCDPDITRLENFAKARNLRPYSSLENMIDHEQLEVASICTPPNTHAQVSIETLTSGLHTLVEKPLSMTVEDGEKILEVLKRSKAKLGVVHNMLYDKTLQRCLQRVKENHIGEVRGVEVKMLLTSNDEKTLDPNHWCHKIPGGRFGEMLAHPIYIAQRFVANLDATHVHVGKIGTIPWMLADELMTYLAADGAFGIIHVSFNSSRSLSAVYVYGTNGIIRVDMGNKMLFQLGLKESLLSGGYWRDVTSNTVEGILSPLRRGYESASKYSTHLACISSFVKRVANGQEPDVTCNMGYQAVKLLHSVCAEIDKQTGRVFPAD